MPHQEFLVRLLVAALLGGIVGLERERREWRAGLRTHMLVCLGSALIMIVSTYGFDAAISANRIILDPSRVAAQVVSGIGFLGAGTILISRHEVIRGLTTAASLWTVAAVGLAVGGGLYVSAICTTLLIVIILALVKLVERRLFHRHRSRQVTVLIDRERASLLHIEEALSTRGLAVSHITLKRGSASEEDCVEFRLARGERKDAMLEAISTLHKLDGVREVNL
jgi:putative Mg2+ transporter-C (MgtC) family protein